MAAHGCRGRAVLEEAGAGGLHSFQRKPSIIHHPEQLATISRSLMN